MAEADPNLRLHRLLAYVRSGEPDLTNRQMALLMFVAETPGPHQVRDLAFMLGTQKPVITRAVTTLAGLGFLERQHDPADGRNRIISATDAGRAFLGRIPL